MGIGSVAEKVAHNADLPVLVLREDSPIGTEKLAKGEQALRILIPLDVSCVQELLIHLISLSNTNIVSLK